MNKAAVDYDRIIEICENIDFPAVENLLFTLDAPVKGASHFMPRLNLLLQGECVFRCYRQGNFSLEKLSSPGIYYCSQSGYQVLQSEVPRDTLSFCYNSDHIRLVLCSQQPTWSRQVINTSQPLPESGKKLISVMEQLWREGEYAMCRRMLNELFILSVKTVKNSQLGFSVSTSQLWVNIISYINTHPGERMSRSGIAGLFGISPGYVSKLARKYHHSDFSSVLSEFQLGHAAMLLSSSDLSIPEIAETTGFKYTSYFFRAFKKYYHTTPGEYRRKHHQR